MAQTMNDEILVDEAELLTAQACVWQEQTLRTPYDLFFVHTNKI